LATLVVLLGLYWWLALPRLRKLSWWDGFVARCNALLARLWLIAGSSKTIAVAYAAELLGMLHEMKLLDWSQLVGPGRGGRVMVVLGAVMIVLRLITRTAVAFKAQG